MKKYAVAAASACACVIMLFLVMSVVHISLWTSWVMAVIIITVVSVSAWLFPAELYTPTPGVSRLAAVIMSIAGVIAALTTSSAEHFGVALFMLMAALIAGGFLFEMLRVKRLQLIESLSSIIFMGTLGLVASGWMVTEMSREFVQRHHSVAGYVAAFVVAGVLCISLSVSAWASDRSSARNAQNTQNAQNNQNGLNARSAAVDNAGSESLVSPVWGYAGLAAMLSGIFPLMIVLLSIIVEQL
ncbi:hypothetical protein [Alloscardovia omnicolens]|uniref:hypothetical protein n=1 Tax=Alloscardovia omnicolens TaxID=419015 RepID=UPI003A5E74C5